MRFILFGEFTLEKCGNFWKNGLFRADMAGLGKYSMGGYGRIGVYRVKLKYEYYDHTLASGTVTLHGPR